MKNFVMPKKILKPDTSENLFAKREAKLSKKTGWFDGIVSPVHVGWYERRFAREDNAPISGDIAMQYWDGSHWGKLVRSSKENRSSQTGFYSEWRGLREPHDFSQELPDVPLVNVAQLAKAVKMPANLLLAHLRSSDIEKQSESDAWTEHFIDGLNVANWKTTLPNSLAMVLLLACEFHKRGIPFMVIFDANSRHLFNDEIYGRLPLEFPEYFSEVPGKSKADDFLLLRAQSTGGNVVSNDQFRDYVVRHPWVKSEDSSRLIKGMTIKNNLLVPALEIDVLLDCNAAELYERFCRQVGVCG